MAEQNEKKERGGCLTAFLWVFTIIYGLSVLLDVFAVSTKTSLVGIISAILAIIALGSLIAIFRWKKAGVIGFAGAYVISTVVSLFTSSTTTTTVAVSPAALKAVSIIIAVIVLAIFYFVIKPVYKYLD